MPTLFPSLAGLLLLSIPLVAADAASRMPAAEANPGWTAPALPPCTCRAAGRTFDMGQETCLATADGPRLAICAMDQNVTSWKPTVRSCPSASRGPGARLG